MDLQELITRGRFLFSSAQARLEVFKEVNGRRTAKEIAGRLGRHVNNVLRDLAMIRDAGLIQEKAGTDGVLVKRDGYPVYERIPLARTVPLKYFEPVGQRPLVGGSASSEPSIATKARQASKRKTLKLPSIEEILDICKRGEDQIFEFKGPGVEIRKITKEVAAMLHTRQGGIVFYGIEDDGTIQGSNQTRQKFDQSLQNSLQNTIDPPPTVTLHEKNILGSRILLIVVPPWNKKDVYLYDGKVFIRKGTNVFGVKSEESKKLHRGEYIGY